MEFVSLHAHSTFSFMDGYGLPREHATRVRDLGGRALAQTDHGNVTGHVKHEQACQGAGIKGLFGCEVYTAPVTMREDKNLRKWHLTVLAKDQPGYANLLRLVSRSWDEGFYRWPTVLGPMLVDHAEGLVVLSGCSDSHLNCVLLGGKGIPEPTRPRYKEARAIALGYADLLGDDYYLECQQFPELERTRTINAIYSRLSKDTGIPLVATADVHYPDPEDNEMQKILHAAGRNTGTVAAAEAGWEYNIRLTHPTSDDFILQRLVKTGLTYSEAEEAVLNTGRIADRCNVTLPKADWIRFPGTRKDVIWT